MLMVLAFTVPVVSIWGLANQQTMTLLRLKRACGESFDRRCAEALTAADFRLAALAQGLSLLETGVPPGEVLEGLPETYRCKVQVAAPAGVEPLWVLTFEVRNRDAGDGTEDWRLTAIPYDANVHSGLDWPVAFVPVQPSP
jgi:hypothetical protein